MDRDDRLRVVIVGAGIGGLTAAAALDADGHRVTVVESRPAIPEDGGYLGIQSNAGLALEHIGLQSAVLGAGVPVDIIELCSWTGRRLAWWSPGRLGGELGAPNVTVPRGVLLGALAGAARNASLLLGQPVVAVRENDLEVVIELRSSQQLRADVVLGADGLRSAVRELVGLPGRPRYAGYHAWRGRADFRPAALGSGRARHYLSHDRTFGCWPLPGGATYWAATRLSPRLVDPDVETAPVEPHASLLETFGDTSRPILELIRGTRPDQVLLHPVFALSGVESWCTRRVALLGDAAHAMEPTTGQGAAQAMLDALCLVDRLKGSRRSTPLDDLSGRLHHYQESRRLAVGALAAEAAGIGRMHHVGHPAKRVVRDAVLRATPHRVWQRRAQLRLMSPELAGLPRTGVGSR